MSILYCTIPHLPVALARRQDSSLAQQPLVLLGPEERVLDASPEAASRGVAPGQTARAAAARCPDARLVDADVASCRAEVEAMLGVLERASERVEPHGWGAAYVDLAADLVGDRDGQRPAAAVCGDIGRAMRAELGEALQPALGWNTTKFTAQVAARRTQPGRLLAVTTARERPFLKPLPVALLPLDGEAVQRLHFLGLRTLGQYAALPRAAVGQQFGRAGILAHRCARGEDDRPVLARDQAPRLEAGCELEAPLVDREQLMAALRVLAAPLLAELRSRLQACGQVRLTVHFGNAGSQECARAFLLPVAGEDRVVGALGQLLDAVRWPAAALGLHVALEQIQDAVPEQLSLFPGADARALVSADEHRLDEVRRYLAARFGANCLRRAALVQPGAPLPEWRVGWPADTCSTGGAGGETP